MTPVAPPATANPANAPSRRFFDGAGLRAGMRVLDIGCGDGDLSRLVAGLIGDEGEVVAIDRVEASLATARLIPPASGAGRIEYRMVDLTADWPALGSFDAIVGRRVLMYLPDAAATLARLARLARPGAILAFQEHARAALPAGPGDLPCHRRLYDWVWDTVAAEGGDVGLGFRLADMMRAAGFTVGDVRSEGVSLLPGIPSFIPTLARVMLPRMIAHGIVSAADVDAQALGDALEAERLAVGGTIIWDLAMFHVGRLDAEAR